MNETLINVIFGIIILVLNSIPILIRQRKYFGITLTISILLAVIRILFIR